MFTGSTFYTPILVETDIHAGGHFFYLTYKKKLQFHENGYVEFSYKVIEDHWSWQDYYKNVLFTGTYNEPGSGHYNLDCKLSNIAGTQMTVAGFLSSQHQLLCSVFINNDGNTTYLSEVYLLETTN